MKGDGCVQRIVWCGLEMGIDEAPVSLRRQGRQSEVGLRTGFHGLIELVMMKIDALWTEVKDGKEVVMVSARWDRIQGRIRGRRR
jgi:hypothetical protein